MEPSNNSESKYWKSLRAYHNDPSVGEEKAREFAKDVTGDFDVDSMSPISRKQFLALVSASAAFAAAGCTNYRDKGEIVPYTKKPEEITLGKANYYASTLVENGQEYGILVKTREGRPIKIDGNPDHPTNKGKITSKGQASILNLYDPERLKDPMLVESGILSKSSWKEVDTKIVAALTAAVKEGKEIAVVSHTVTSPTAKKVFNDFAAKYPTAKFYSYELFNDLNRKSAWMKSTGGSVFPLIKWNEAKIILTLESDILGYEGNMPEQTRMFAENRNVDKTKNFNRLYSADATMSSTAMNADYRLRIRPDQQLEFVLALINEFKPTGKISLKEFASKYSVDSKILKQLVKDLNDNKGKSIVHAGNGLPESVHIAVNVLNEVLGNSALYNSKQTSVEHVSLSTKNEWESLVSRMNGGNVGVVVHFDSNPVYHLAPDFEYAEGLKKVKTVVSLTESQNESSEGNQFVLPVNHEFESWGDHQTRTGIVSLQQPVISPLYNSRQKESLLLSWSLGTAESYTDDLYHKYLMNRWEKEVYPAMKVSVDFRTFWFSSLHDGVVEFDETTKAIPSAKLDVLSLVNVVSSSNDFVLYLHDNYFIGDGRNANNGWLQEMPHPASKIAWDNYAALSVATSKELSVEENSMIEVAVGGRSLKLPVHIQPGLADKFVAVMLGYGRTIAGTIGTGVGFNANTLMSKTSTLSPWLYSGVTVTKSDGTYLLASTQEHHSLDDTFLKDIHKTREIIQEGTLIQYIADPKFIEKEHHDISIVPKIKYDGIKWAMSIDLNKCTGCGVCTLSCNVENNIPVVGKDQLNKGREMTWIRIDRYFSGTSDAPSVSNQPMLCQQCDNAPCENVCPVSATTHSPDGLNQMAYNRCVGTKYCSNNCPYKVRRFNFFDFRDNFNDAYQYQQPLNMLHNPEVTVRSRGVMEKCTFCVQRIMEARQHAIEDNRELKGSDVVTACQEACPAEAIIFGDVNDKTSEIYKYRKHEIGYRVLEEINVAPNVTYIAKLRNVESQTEKA
ncbi:MAG: TAT-variant-translocated molybdopterin oxidoreductase [Bacteroidota bacterium]|nr:TAT-variant-translocated molybdopterin oxidoreductase [Bacteroidota bacterium]